MRRGEIWWASLREPRGSERSYRRPLVIVQSDYFTESRIETIIGAAVTSNTRLAAAPGKVLLQKKRSGLSRDSVVNVSQLVTVNKSFLTERIGRLSATQLQRKNSLLG
jgi:mRNA interferase MazF